VNTARPSARVAIATGLLVAFAVGVIAVDSFVVPTRKTLEASHAPKSLQEPSYLFEGKPEPAWVGLGSPCGPIRDAHGRPVLFATDVQVPGQSGRTIVSGAAATESLTSMSCPQLTRWVSGMLASGKAKAFATSAPEYQAWCSEDEVIHHNCH
jgi:hypothetical protein